MQTATAMDSYALNNNTKAAIDESLLLKVDDFSGVPVFASLACYFAAALHRPIERLKIMHAALTALRKPEESDGCCQKHRVVNGTADDDFEQLWVIQDEGGIVLLFPEDYYEPTNRKKPTTPPTRNPQQTP